MSGRKFLTKLLAAPEGRVLIIGLGLLALWLALFVFLKFDSPEMFRRVMTLVAAQIAGGRAAGISAGFVGKVDHWAIVTLASLVDVTIVFLVFPIVTFSYKHLVEFKLLKKLVADTLGSAETHRPWVSRYGFIGLLFFVWFPLYSTGPLVGSVIGFMLGVRTWLNLLVVTSGTVLAIISWVAFFDRPKVEAIIMRFGYVVPLAVVVVALLLAVCFRLRSLVKSSPGAEEKKESEAAEASISRDGQDAR